MSMKKLTPVQKEVLLRIASGDRCWRYSAEGFGWLLAGDKSTVKDRMVFKRTLSALEDAELIEVDPDETFYRESGVNDDVYKATEKGKQYAAQNQSQS